MGVGVEIGSSLLDGNMLPGGGDKMLLISLLGAS